MTLKRLNVPPVDAPAAFDLHVAARIKALANGKATEAQQITAYNWIYREAGGIGAQSFRANDPYSTAFMEGRRFVAAQIVALTAMSIEELKKRTTT